MKLKIKARVKRSYVENLTIMPKFDGPLDNLTHWMEQLGWSYADESADHVDFYGEGRYGFLKVTWKKIKDGLWKSVQIEDVKFPSGHRLEAKIKGDTYSLPLSDAITEHKKLVKVLKKKNPKELDEEAADQGQELQEMLDAK